MYGRGLRTFCSGIPAAKNILPLTIPSYHLTDTLARYNNAGWVSRNALHTYYFASFFRRARAAKTIGFYVRKPWARGAVLLKIHSPLPSMAEVASGNLHLIPGGSLCHQVAGSHHWQLARCGKGVENLSFATRQFRSRTRHRGRFAEQKKDLTLNYTRHLTK